MKSLAKLKREFIYGSFLYHYDLVRQDRKTLSLTVTPEMSILLKSPLQVDVSRIETFLKKKWLWMEKQLTFFGRYKHSKYKRQFVSGESYYYLGRQYLLQVRSGESDQVSLSRGKIVVTLSSKSKYRAKQLLSQWYKNKTTQVFTERFNEMASRFGYKNIPSLKVREMKKRWGSYLGSNTVVLNPKLIHLSKPCIDYVITHELCHVRYKNHNHKFFIYLDEKYPNWQTIKEKLELMGSLIQE